MHMDAKVAVAPLTGAALVSALPEVARLRIAVFRAYPYLYDGDYDYEAEYLKLYANTPGAIVVAARDGANGNRLAGAATGPETIDDSIAQAKAAAMAALEQRQLAARLVS